MTMMFRCGCSPNDFLADDWTKLEGTKARQLFFARKFEAIVHQGVVNKVEDWVEGEGTVPETSKNSYWQNVFHHEDAKPSMNTDVLAAMLALEVSTLSQCKIFFSSLLEATTLAVDSNRDSNLLLLEAVDLSSSQTLQLEVQMRLVLEYFSCLKYKQNMMNDCAGTGKSCTLHHKYLVSPGSPSARSLIQRS